MTRAEDFEVIRTLYDEGVTTSLSVTVPTKFGGRSGFYSLRGVYSSAEGLDLASIPQLILPPEAQDIKDEEGYLFGSSAAQQYLWQDPDNPQVGWGVFGMFGLSDGNPNPIACSAIAAAISRTASTRLDWVLKTNPASKPIIISRWRRG